MTDIKPHILLISQYFYPENFRVNDMACEWVKRGYKVTVLTGIPNYPMGKFYEGYDKKNRIRETWNGVNIIRIPLVARGNSSNKLFNAAGLAANYFSFVISGRRWVKSKEAKNLHADLVFTFEVSPMTQALIGVWYGKRYHVPTFLYAQDLWPENVKLVTGIRSPIVIKPIDKMVDYIYENTGKIFATSKSFVNAIVNRKKRVERSKVEYWAQYAEEFYRVVKLDEKEKHFVSKYIQSENKLKIAFTGNIGYAQGLDIIPKTAEILKKKNIFNIKFYIIGDGRYRKELINEISRRKVEDYLCMIPRQKPESIPLLLAAVDVAYLSYPDPQTIPAKVQSYMACGKCILASAGKETQGIIKEADCGICCEFGNAEQLADAIIELKENSKRINLAGKNARIYFEKNFEKSLLMDKMDEYFRAVGGKKE